ncbi:MAG TPA: electron transfer flavoprotein subunit beta/FixA family protein [Acidimicrobiia bacterium]|nr:electron transfer flavoprotein subunit beta/FixA family protein [Acidimicrobiia bacterium]
MNVIVCVKQIPDPATPYRLEEGSNWLIRPEEQILDDTDRYGVEMGLQIAQATDGTVTVVSMGPSGTGQGIRQALAMGADEAILIEDGSLRGSDALTTARVLAAAIGQREFDLVIAGTESTDGYSGVVPQMLAEILEVASLTYATKVETGDGTVTIHRQTAAGYDVVTSGLPALVSVTAGVVEPRYPTFKGIMDAKKKPIEKLSMGDLGAERAPEQLVLSIVEAPERTGGRKIEDEGEAHQAIVALLAERKVI